MERHLSARIPVSLCKKPVLALFRGGQQFVELCSPPHFRKQGIGLEGGVGAIVMVNRAFQQAQGSIPLATVRQQASDDITRFRISSRQRGGLSLLRDSIQHGGL